jgi:glucose-6-phosphate 1-dehydrogenase
MQPTYPTTLVIFGGTGDLAKNKIIPALFHLFEKGILNEQFKIIGFSRKDLSFDDYREFAKNAIFSKEHTSSEKIHSFLERIEYVQGDIFNVETYEKLSIFLRKSDQELGLCTNKLLYIAVPPNLYEPSFQNIADSGLATPCGVEDKKTGEKVWSRILVEKPFGNDMLVAKKLEKILGSLFDERQIFRIDHYLAKETLQDIVTFRFANAIFEPLWTNEHIEKVIIKLHEKVDISERGAFYDQIGAIKDVGQNHLLQMLALVAMEDPGGVRVDNLRKARYEVLSNVVPFEKGEHSCMIRGQYEEYKNTPGVNSESNTETFFKMTVGVNNKRWRGVPFILESGKAMDQTLTEIKVVFKEKPSFVCMSEDTCSYNNELTFHVNPKEGVSINFWSKKPGFDLDLEQKNLSFFYEKTDNLLVDAYEKLLYDCIHGDQTLFPSTHEIQAEWGIINKSVERCTKVPLKIYKKGSTIEDIINNT